LVLTTTAAFALTMTLTARVARDGAAEEWRGQRSYKGIWEPVNYKADIQFEDVFFVTADVGWIAGVRSRTGGGGVILHTHDGGDSWSIQFGDPESNDRAIRDLFFLDERHGWAVRRSGSGDHQLLRTTDGASWEEAGTIAQHRGGYVFVTPTLGFVATGTEIRRTTDGGRRWTTVGRCVAEVEIGGLTQRGACSPSDVHFPTRQVGYAVAKGKGDYVFLMKTDDGGGSWATTAVPTPGGSAGEAVFFTDENTGFVRVYGGRLFRTADGGASWRAIPATVRSIKFADPDVGWSISYRTMSYTANGGRNWISRDVAWPAYANAFSLPRRDRGFVVGDHGMIYRYRVVPANEAKNALAAPAMPVVETDLDEKVDALDEFVEALEESVEQAPDNPQSRTADDARATTDAAKSSETSANAEDDRATPASPFVTQCCGRSLSRWYLFLSAAEGILPQFVAHYRNTNLLGAGLRMLVVLPQRIRTADAAFRRFKASGNKAEAKANVAALSSAVDGLQKGVAVALQKELPAPDEDTSKQSSSPAEGPEDATERDSTPTPRKPSEGRDDGQTTGRTKEAAKDAAATVKQSLKKRIRFP
jgi:photosystem II stability/assembly factor-like uncharacterized protein